jgi:hypothetical protein
MFFGVVAMAKNGVRRVALGMAASAALLAPLGAWADPVEEAGTSPFSLNTSDDLILNMTPSIASNNGAAENTAPVEEHSSSNWGTLTDGSASTFSYGSVVTPNAGDTLTYYLANVNTNPYGVDLTSADVYTAWADSGRVSQNYTVLYSTTADSGNYQTLATVAYSGAGNYEYTSTATSLDNVARIQITFNSQPVGYVGYQEFIPHGTTATSGTAITAHTSVAIQDGSFETPNAPGGNYTPIPGWTSSGLAQVGINDNNGPFRPQGTPPIPDGSQFAFIQINNGPGSGSLSQKLDDLVIGQAYDLTYYEATRGGDAQNDATFQVSIDGQAIGAADIPGTAWTERSIDFTYNGTDPDPTLAFTMYNPDGNGSDQSIDLDDVQITAVPEPASLTLTALAGIAVLRRRRTR